MIRTEHLRAKSLQAEVEYSKHLKELGSVKQQEDHHRKVAQDTSQSFWQVALKATQTQAQTSPKNSSRPQDPPNYPAHIQRLWQAHDTLQKAQRAHLFSQESLSATIMGVSNAKQRADLIAQLISKASRQRAHRLESRIGEEVAEMAMRRTGLSTELQTAGASRPVLASESIMPSEAAVAPTSSPDVVTFTPLLAQQGVPPRTTDGPGIFIPPADRVRVTHELTVQRVECKGGLSLSCSMRGIGDISLSIVRGEGAGLKVALEPAQGTTLSTLLRERSTLHSRLRGMGIQIDALDIVTGPEATLGRAKRRHRRVLEEEHEDTIA